MASATAAASLRLSSVSGSTALPPGTSSDGEFITFKATMRLPISPRFAASNHSASYPGHDQGMDGVREVLAGWVMRYLPPVRAVLLSFSPTPRFLHPAASFPASASPFDSSFSPAKDPRSLLSTPQPQAAAPDDQDDDDDGETVRFKSLPMVQGTGFTLANVEWEGVGWRPRVGMKLLGTLTLASPSHVSLLLHNLFNASIPSSHIPSHDYEFDPDCAVPPIVLERRNANVPLHSVVDSVKRRAGAAAAADGGEGAVEETVTGEPGSEHLVPQSAAGEADVAKAEEDAEEDQDAEDELKEDEDEALHAERGWWVHRTTREPLGGSDGRIEFTLVDLTTTNSLLSCTGSLLADPFSPSALAALSAHHPSLSAKPDPDASLVKSKVLTTRDNKRKRGRDSESDTGSSGSDSDDDDDDDVRVSSASPAPRGAEAAADAASDSSDSELDNDDDDGVGTGIPRHGVDVAKASQRAQHGGRAVVPTVERAQSVASSRSPSPLPAPAHLASASKKKDAVKVEADDGAAAAAAKAAKKAAKKEKKAAKESKEGRKSKKVKAER
ncbi:hypothetical protein JCM8208_003924 [Rhodotorula glutinis]